MNTNGHQNQEIVEEIKQAFARNLKYSLATSRKSATKYELFLALSMAVREQLVNHWNETREARIHSKAKRVYYLSLEFLIGRAIDNNIINLGIVKEVEAAARELGLNFDDLREQEVDAGLGNGGLGRLAACFLDSLATLQYPAIGYGIRYDYGIFTQVVGGDGGQREIASSWLRLRNVWETPRGNVRYVVHFGGRSEAPPGAQVGEAHRWVGTEDVYAIGFDRLIPGN